MIYVDFERSGSGYTGTELDPWGWDDFVNGITVGLPDDVKAKGIGSLSGVLTTVECNNNSIENWLADEPWRINNFQNVTIIQDFISLKGGILSAADLQITSTYLPENSVSNMIMIAGDDIRFSYQCGQFSTIKGCTFIAGEYMQCATATCTGIVEVYDSIFSATLFNRPPYPDTNLALLDHCVLTCAYPTEWTIQNCQENWTPPTWPAWNAQKEQWKASLLSVGITTPQPGNPPYTGYETGLWGSPRVGIGGFWFLTPINYFSSGTIAVNTPVTSTVNKTELVNKIQGVGSDTYFDQTSEVHSVHVRYEHSDDRQRKTIIHTGTGLTGTATWSDGARDGTWEKSLVTVCDRDGAKAVLSRSDIGSNEDVVKSGSTVFLNN